MKRLLWTLLCALGLIAPLLTPLVSNAQAASAPSLVFDPASLSAANGGTFSLALRLDPSGVSVNTINVIVRYPASQLTFTGLDKAGSAFDTFLPATPAAHAGSLNFSAASFGGNIGSADVLVGTLSFSAKTDSGSAKIDLTGSQAAANGAAVDVTTSGSRIDFSPAGNGTASTIGITAVSVDGITLHGGTVRWKTAAPATSSVDYGADTNYGLSNGSADLTTDHTVDLSDKFAGRTTVHFRVTSVDAQGNRQSSADQSFTTLGYTVRIQVVDPAGRPRVGAAVTVGTGSTYRTDSGGYVTVPNVAAGSQHITIAGKRQTITVKAITTPQQFRLVAAAGRPLGLYLGMLAVLAVLLGLVIGLYPLRGRHQSVE